MYFYNKTAMKKRQQTCEMVEEVILTLIKRPKTLNFLQHNAFHLR